MSEPDPYRSLYPSQSNIQRLHTVAGEQVGNTNRVNALGGTIEQATYSTAPYKGRDKNKCMAKGDTCNGNRVKDSKYCVGHMRSFGMIENDKRAPRKPKGPE
jgi:hypothetical protein